MNTNRWLWRTAGIAALLSTLLFLFGFVYAIQEILNPKPSDLGNAAVAQPQDELQALDKIQILAMGDSLTLGTGDESGEGYVGKIKKKLEKTSQKQVFVINSGINGYVIDQLLAHLNEPAVPDQIKKANIVTLTIGGNDLFRSGLINTNANSATEMNTDPMTYLDLSKIRKTMPTAVAKLGQIFKKISELNPQARIVYVSLYNPYYDYDKTHEGSLIVQEWNQQAFALANKYGNITVVPTYDLFEKNIGKYLYGDHFHPNQAGYERIADRVMQALQ